MNKYGDVLPKSDPRVVPSSGTTEMYTLDQLTAVSVSEPATVTGGSVKNSYAASKLTFPPAGLATGTAPLALTIGTTPPQTMNYTLGAGDRYPEVAAKNIENAINAKLASQAITDRVTVSYNGSTFVTSGYYGPVVYTDKDKFQKVDFPTIEKGKQEHAKDASDGWVGVIILSPFIGALIYAVVAENSQPQR